MKVLKDYADLLGEDSPVKVTVWEKDIRGQYMLRLEAGPTSVMAWCYGSYAEALHYADWIVHAILADRKGRIQPLDSRGRTW
jgi:hypothetical protein